jgi:hypothetical protein
MNPIINYLESDMHYIVPKKLLEEEIIPILQDPDVDHYLNVASSPCLDQHRSMEEFLPTLKMFAHAAITLGYLYGKEGNKTPEEVATEVLKELNIKEGK